MAHDHGQDVPVVHDLTPAFRWAAALNAGFVVVN
jgi:hypothetical protein